MYAVSGKLARHVLGGLRLAPLAEALAALGRVGKAVGGLPGQAAEPEGAS